MVRHLLFLKHVRLGERADHKLTGSRWPWERWYSESVGFFQTNEPKA